MLSIQFTDFRKNASSIFSQVENGETVEVKRHGKTIAHIIPPIEQNENIPAWKRPGLRFSIKGEGLAQAILNERDEKDKEIG
ncbi:MAG: type II toxin-antitoxin system Phd/YefM family antitoxin [Deferribacteres bacterium]|nr:type II toxin-antitoxin system Phd/YefM family antitoxin [candidate division KSB1 bacterium]MCB9504290.1 type II toxin-antitoxin system Phd/YefM family antitoxin [Deferribacteres bacterium]